MTTETKHTPGPWTVNQHNHVDGDLWLSIGHFRNGSKVGPIADVGVYSCVGTIKYLIAPPEEQWANARLIAAAPELYEALKWIASQQDLFFAECSQAEEIVMRARAAIAKAEAR